MGLGVRYILEGSVQKSGSGVRINAQLIDALTGRHLWAERYDSDVNDLFAAQDEIVETVVAALAIKVDAAERERASRKDTDSLEAYDYYLRGADIRFEWGKEANVRTRRLLEKAIALDPKYARAYAALAWTHVNDWRFGWVEDKDASKERALDLAQKALDLDPSDAESYWALGVVHLFSREFDKAMPLYEKAVSLNRNDARLLVGSSPAWIYVGRMNEAIAQIQRGMRLDPHQANTALGYLGWAYYDAKEYEKALSTLKKISEPAAWIHRYLAATYVRLGRLDEARAEAAIAIKNQPDYSIEKAKVWPYQDENQRKHYNDALVEVGIPEKSPLPLPDKPSIAVLPFANMSGDPEQDYFVDGMTDDLITDLSKVSGLFVIARNSSFAYKGKSPDVRQVARELGVKYVLEGSVRRAGDQVRINAQLIDATTGGHLWAERYDGTLNDVFALQDKVTQKIVTALAVKLTAGEAQQVAHKGTNNVAAYDAFLQGWEHYRRGTAEEFAKAVSYFEQAIKWDPNYARAHSALAAVYWNSAWKGWTRSLGLRYGQALEQARGYLEKAMEEPSALTHQVASEKAAYFRPKPDEALTEAERAIALDANDPAGHLAMANALIKAGKPAVAVEHVQTAMRLDPHYPASYLTRLGRAQFARGQFQDAVGTLERAATRNPDNDWTFVYLAAAYGHLGREKQAKTAVENANALRAKAGWGTLTLQTVAHWTWVGDWKRLREGLREAGVESGSNWVALVTSAPSGFEIKGATTIDVATAKALHDRGVPFVDVHRHGRPGHIPGAYFLEGHTHGPAQRRLEFNEVRLLEIVDKAQEVVIYSAQWDLPHRDAANACAKAVTWGFQKVYFFADGLRGWKAAGYPIEKGG